MALDPIRSFRQVDAEHNMQALDFVFLVREKISDGYGGQLREAPIYSSISHVADQIGKIATRTAQVVAGTTMPGRCRDHVGIDQRFLREPLNK